MRRDRNLGTNKYLTIAIEKKEFVQLALAQPNTKHWLVDYEWHHSGEQEVNAQKLVLPNGI